MKELRDIRMAKLKLQVTFPDGAAAEEGRHKLQALRISELSAPDEYGFMTAVIDEAVADRAITLIQGIGGEVSGSVV